PQPIRLAPPTPAAPQASTPVEPDAGWVAEVCPDRAFFDRNDDEVEFPDPPTGRRVVLTGERTLIGRRSPRRDIRPQIDLSVAPEDLGVSRAHAFLDHAADGQLTVTDLGSANGTWIGEDRTPIAPGRSLPLADGGHIYVGSFTRITVHRTR
ncbi:FHA domain-containing protein, partial [Frankia canadensis]|uniref:FHA domain-containing protein n=1 Tax=Frankia canadensis TaxID=1836972 RepID=UPI001FB03F48